MLRRVIIVLIIRSKGRAPLLRLRPPPPALPLPSPPLRRIRIIGRGIFYRVAPLFQSGIKGAAPRPADWRRLSARLGNVATLRIILSVGDRVGFLVAASRQFVRRLSRRAHRFPPPA